MKKYNTSLQTEALLLTAIGLPGRNIKQISTDSGIKASTLYKWKTSKTNLSPTKMDKLLIYFMQNEPERLQFADLILDQAFQDYMNNDNSTSFDRGSDKEE